MFASKQCAECSNLWTPRDRHQAKRNKFCSTGCMAKRLSTNRLGIHKKPEAVCKTCSQEFWTNSKALSKAKFCSTKCYGIAKTADPKSNAHLKVIAQKGRAAWTDASKESYLKNMSGEKNPAWKGGVTFKRNKGNYIGPKYVRCPKEFIEMSRKAGYIMEHRLVMAKSLNRILTRTEVVHHRDHNTRNNKLENLELFANNALHKRAEGAEKRTKK